MWYSLMEQVILDIVLKNTKTDIFKTTTLAIKLSGLKDYNSRLCRFDITNAWKGVALNIYLHYKREHDTQSPHTNGISVYI